MKTNKALKSNKKVQRALAQINHEDHSYKNYAKLSKKCKTLYTELETVLKKKKATESTIRKIKSRQKSSRNNYSSNFAGKTLAQKTVGQIDQSTLFPGINFISQSTNIPGSLGAFASGTLAININENGYGSISQLIDHVRLKYNKSKLTRLKQQAHDKQVVFDDIELAMNEIINDESSMFI